MVTVEAESHDVAINSKMCFFYISRELDNFNCFTFQNDSKILTSVNTYLFCKLKNLKYYFVNVLEPNM